MISYRHQDFDYDSTDEEAAEYLVDRAKKDYSRIKPIRSMRKRARNRTGYLGSNINNRRQKRVTW